MKKYFSIVFYVLLFTSFLESAYVGKVYFRHQPGYGQMKVFKVPKDFYESWTLRNSFAGKNGIAHRENGEIKTSTIEDQLGLMQAYFESEEQKGNIRLKLVQNDPNAFMEHYRYGQYYSDIEVFGGEIIKHFKEGKLIGINGEYYEVDRINTIPLITKEIAVDCLKRDLGRFDVSDKQDETKLIIFPLNDEDFHLAYQIILEDGRLLSMTGIISATTGEVLLKYPNLYNDDLTIGRGIGYHGEVYKFPSTLFESVYWLFDQRKARPINQYTYVLSPGYFYTDDDNYWNWDGVLINVHAYIGMTYDYYYLVHSRNGIDDNNMDIRATVHSVLGTDNAYWDSSKKQMFFMDPHYAENWIGAAIDAVAHEYSHGVTQYTSRLAYYCDIYRQPGALNESFSDIMGTAVEFYFQDRGNGFNKADWVCGEDTYLGYGPNKYMRSLESPNSKRSWFYGIAYPHPCHISQCYAFPITPSGDYGGVHFNSTLFSHAYYLLSDGGTNKVSRKSVTGISLEKATKIFFRAWAYYMTPNASFWNAANVLVQSAIDLYGAGSNEHSQTIRAMDAIGF